jgi:hypothetical protein
VQLTRAATINIQIDDPRRLLGVANSISAPLAVGVRETAGRFHPAREVRRNGTTRVLQVAVPYGTQLSVWFHSWKFLVADAQGVALNNWGLRLPFVVQNNGIPPNFVFQITGEVQK